MGSLIRDRLRMARRAARAPGRQPARLRGSAAVRGFTPRRTGGFAARGDTARGTGGFAARGDTARLCGSLQRVPSAPLPLLGREDELADITQRLATPHARLVTLTGPGGCGKTRLAIEVAQAAPRRLQRPACFVDLAPVSQPELVLSTIASQLGIREEVGVGLGLAELVARSLAGRELLLVLDNCEHVLAAAPAIAELLEACPSITVLATSREPLHLRWEHEFPVRPLPVPNVAAALSAATLASEPAVALFVQRAWTVDPTFELDEHNARTVAEICVRLDGLPLAIELAASRVKLLRPHALLERLANRLDILEQATRDVPLRHRTLRAAIRWSYDLLAAPEQAFFRRLATFSGGCSLEAAADVCADGASPRDVLERIRSLLDKGLVVREDTTSAEPRFGLLETIREFALEQLVATGELDRVRARHARYFAVLARNGAHHFWGAGQVAWLDTLESELGNLRAALAWSLSATGDPRIGLRIAAATFRLWDLRGHITEGVSWFEPLLRLADEPSAARAVALVQLAAHQFMLGQRPHALLDEAIEMSFARGYHSPLLHALTGKCAVALYSGQIAEAERYGDQALVVARQAPTTQGPSFAHFWRGNAALAGGALDLAVTLANEGLALARRDADGYATATLLLLSGQAALACGAHERAAVDLREALDILRGVRSVWIHAQVVDLLAAAEHELGRHAAAVRLLAAAESLRDTVGMIIGVPLWQQVVDATLTGCRAALGDESFEQAWAEGLVRPPWDSVEVLRNCGASPPERTPSERSTASNDGLTAREREVASLIGGGLTSREIARHLVISIKTADTHADRLREKLGLRSRAEIAVWASQHGLLHQQSA